LVQALELMTYASLIISIFAGVVSLVRFKKESRIQRQADTVSALSDIIKLIDNDRAIHSRGILRADQALNQLKNQGFSNDPLNAPDVDDETIEAVRHVATTYDRLGFILKHDPSLEKEILEWHGDVIGDMWLMTRALINKKWRLRNPQYAKEFERLASKALASPNPKP